MDSVSYAQKDRRSAIKEGRASPQELWTPPFLYMHQMRAVHYFTLEDMGDEERAKDAGLFII